MACKAKRAPSLWLNYDYKEPGDILMQDVFVPSTGLAKCTYYCCLNWNSGQEGGGYCGIQDHPDGRAFIFSIWDPQQVKEVPITAVSKGPGTWTDRFGGEGTGLKSMNFELGWKEDQWYTLLVRRWDGPDRDATYFGCWVHDHNLDSWTHLITMKYPVPCVNFVGMTQSFLEDWGFTSPNYRCVRYKGGFKRKLDKTWVPFNTAKFQVNMNDVTKGEATTNFDAQCPNSEEGVCIAAGGEVKGHCGTCCTFSGQGSNLHPNKQSISFQGVELHNDCLEWKVHAPGAPQFQYKVMMGNEELSCGVETGVTRLKLNVQALSKASGDTAFVVELQDILGNCVAKQCAFADLM